MQPIYGALDFHSYSQLLLRPYGWSTTALAPHETEHAGLGTAMRNAIAAVHSSDYTSQVSSSFYPSSGTADDWFYGEGAQTTNGGIHAYSYCVELRDTGSNGFELPANQIIPQGEEMLPAAKIFIETAVRNPLSYTAPPPPPPPPPPGAALFVVTSSTPSGACTVSADGTCFTDGTGAHENNERCTIEVLADVTLATTQFDTESGFDYMTVNGQRYSGNNNGPDGVAVNTGSTISWYADYSITNGGFTICGQAAGPPPPVQSAFSLASASPSTACVVTNSGLCFTDGSGAHGNNERCTISVLRDTTLQVAQFDTESGYDYLLVNGQRFSGTTGPAGISVNAGETISWYADYSITNGGFVICSP